jgi:hypothetical protein
LLDELCTVCRLLSFGGGLVGLSDYVLACLGCSFYCGFFLSCGSPGSGASRFFFGGGASSELSLSCALSFHLGTALGQSLLALRGA